MERDIYANFNDNVSSYNVIDGQFYWGTHFTTNSLSLQLSTDEMTEQQLQDFKHWFKPGETKELVLAEYPNRAIQARVSKVPEYHMIPFEKRIVKKFAQREYEVSTTVYRGDIELSFIMDDPFWYSIYNILPSYGEDGAEQRSQTLGVSIDHNNPPENSFNSNKDYLKIILEDGIPTQEMIHNEGKTIVTGDIHHNVSTAPLVGIAVVGDRLRSTTLVISSNNGAPSAYLYYTGTAPAPTILKFDLTPEIENNGYISKPYNKIYNQVYKNTYNTDNELSDYNKIIVGKEEFQFTTPSLYTGYNQALNIINSDAVKEGTSTIDLHILLNEGVNEYYSRSWALGILNYLKAFQVGINLQTSQISDKQQFVEQFTDMMQKFLNIKVGGTYEEPVYAVQPASFEFNSKTGVSTGNFYVRAFTQEGLDQWDKLANYKDPWNVRIILKENWITDVTQIDSLTNHFQMIGDTTFTEMWPIISNTDYNWLLYNAGFTMMDKDGETELFTVKPFMDYTYEKHIKENVGDMVYGKYLYLTEKKIYNDEGIIAPSDSSTCVPIITDYPSQLQNFDIQYKHMYL